MIADCEEERLKEQQEQQEWERYNVFNTKFNICSAEPIGTPIKNKYKRDIRPFVTSYEELIEFCKPLYDTKTPYILVGLKPQKAFLKASYVI